MTAANGRDLGPAWVTGATSFLGRHVARQLARGGYSVLGFARSEVATAFTTQWGFARIESGQFDADLFERACRRTGTPSVVFHSVGSGSVGQAATDPAGDFERTFKSTKQLLEILCRIAPSGRLIYPSSAAVYGAARLGPIAEQERTHPISVYGTNKLLTENMCRERASVAGLNVVIARFFSVYGPPQRKLLLWELGRRLLSGEKRIVLSGSGEESRDFIHVTDAAAIVARLADAPEAPTVINVGTGHATSIAGLAAGLALALRVNAKIEFSGTPRPGDPAYQQADVTRLAAMGYRAFTPLDVGLVDYARWLRETLAVPSVD